MRVVHGVDEIERAARDLAGARSLGGVFVPTMGALHAGHAALIAHAADLARLEGFRAGCVVSIFVNPTQFDDPSDYERYPRTLEADLRVCRAAGASVVFVPPVEAVYPPGEPIEAPPLPPVAVEPGLEDAHRPGHFAGVARVVLRLFRLLEPDAAVFGEKDWQQLRLVETMTESLGLGVRIVPHPTVREPDGLAMSSRNRFLSQDERRRAASISRALCEADAEPDARVAEARMRRVLAGSGIDVEYAVVRDAGSLGPPIGGACRALIACRIGPTRLIDNAPWRAGVP